MPESISIDRSILFRFFLVVAPVLIFLLLAELGLRLFLNSHIFYDVEMTRYANILKQKSSNPLIGHVHRPGKSAHLMGVDIQINSDGLRDDEVTPEKNGKLRIILLGDSLTFGWGVEKRQTFEQRLEDKFNKHAPTELINFGTGNYNTTQELTLFQEKGLRYRPDAVFLFYFINDAELVPERSPYAWLSHSRLATFFWSRVKALMALRSPPQSFETFYRKLYQDRQIGWVEARAALVKLKEICDSENIQLKVVILPELHNLAEYTFKEEHASISAHLDKNEIDHIDLAPYFSDWDTPTDLWVARDDAHPNARAHDLIAEFSFPFLSDMNIVYEHN